MVWGEAPSTLLLMARWVKEEEKKGKHKRGKETQK